jgi:hypothetical protein
LINFYLFSDTEDASEDGEREQPPALVEPVEIKEQ